MNRYAMQHIVDSSYCYPVSEHEIVLRLRTAKDDIVSARVIYESKYAIGARQLMQPMKKCYSTELYDFFEIKLTLEDTRLAYVFSVSDDGEKFYFFSEDGITEDYDFTLGFYNFFQYPYINRADILPPVTWMDEAVFYQIFVDRFCMGDKAKDTSYINCEWGDVPTPKTFAGGDIKGILQNLDYIKGLGCNAIYLTPVFTSISNHKYDISDYYRVDPQFGSNEDLKKLVQECHSRGMRIVLDAVFNHCSERIMQFQDVLEKGKESEYFDWFVIDGDRVNEAKDNYETFAACDYMPKFNTSNPKVQQFLIDIAVFYIREYDIDGWRLDVSDEISHDFWRTFRKAVKQAKADAVIIGENWHDASNYLRGDQYDSIMNYAFTKACLDYFAWGKKNAQEFAWKLNDILMRNTETVNRMMLNLLDSHDTHRFFKETGSNRLRTKAALALLYLFDGAPCIFYGTELLIYGGYDPDCRRCMDWSLTGEDGPYGDVYRLLAKLSEIRIGEHVASGKNRIFSENDVFILENTYGDRVLRLMVNLTDRERKTEFGTLKAGSFGVSMNGGFVIYEEE